MQDISNILAKELLSFIGNKGQFLDKDNILWKFVDDKWIGKRSVWTFDLQSCWLEETTKENVHTWWCGEDADYTEIFYEKQ